MGFTVEARQKLEAHFAGADVETALDNHLLKLGSDIGFFTGLGDDRFRDVFGVVWDRSIDKDIGNVEGRVLDEPSLAGYQFPDPLDERFFARHSRQDRASIRDRFRVFQIGFSLYERAWTLRGMETLMMDFYDHPAFVARTAGRDCRLQHRPGPQGAGLRHRRRLFRRRLGAAAGAADGPGDLAGVHLSPARRMYAVVREAGKFVMIHSCGDVDELFDDLVAAGLNCFNPFQPEVMDVCRPAARSIAAGWRFTAGCRRRRRCRSARRRTSRPKPGGCSNWEPREDTSWPRPTTSKGTCRWKTCSK